MKATGFGEQSSISLPYQCCGLFKKKMIQVDKAKSEISPVFLPHILLPSQNQAASYITHNASWVRVWVRKCIRLHVPQLAVGLVHPKTFRQTLMSILCSAHMLHILKWLCLMLHCKSGGWFLTQCSECVCAGWLRVVMEAQQLMS